MVERSFLSPSWPRVFEGQALKLWSTPTASPRVQTELRWLYEHSQWPIKQWEQAWIKELNHTAWAIEDAAHDCELIHVQSGQALAFSPTDRSF